jgi:nucleotide-binding universal stress UspA family protein
MGVDSGRQSERGVRVVLIHVLERPSLLVSGLAPLGPVPAVLDDEAVRHAHTLAITILQHQLSERGVDGDVLVIDDPHAAAAIVAKADEIGPELLVVGTRGRTGLARVTLGSGAEQVIAHAPCSVLAVRLAD